MPDVSPNFEVADLSPEQRSAIERMLGRKLDPDEVVNVFVAPADPALRGRGGVIKSAPEGEEAVRAAREVLEAFDALAAQVKPGTDIDELNRLIDEAVHEARHERSGCE